MDYVFVDFDDLRHLWGKCQPKGQVAEFYFAIDAVGVEVWDESGQVCFFLNESTLIEILQLVPVAGFSGDSHISISGTKKSIDLVLGEEDGIVVERVLRVAWYDLFAFVTLDTALH